MTQAVLHIEWLADWSVNHRPGVYHHENCE
jgi:hypothetical protein